MTLERGGQFRSATARNHSLLSWTKPADLSTPEHLNLHLHFCIDLKNTIKFLQLHYHVYISGFGSTIRGIWQGCTLVGHNAVA